MTEPAFPYTYDDPYGRVVHPGMTLRDYFAGQALAGKLAHTSSHPDYAHAVATNCYRFADAMLKARDGG